MADPDVDDLEDEQPDDSNLVKDLRRQLREARKEAKQVPDLTERLAKYERTDLLTEAKLGDLSDKRAAALFREVGDSPTVQDLQDAARELFDITVEPDPEEVEVEAMRQAGQAVRGGQPPGSGAITPQTYSSWDPDKRQRFIRQHPEAVESLKRGEPVVGVQFS